MKKENKNPFIKLLTLDVWVHGHQKLAAGILEERQ